ncbi:hypothetical protein SAMN05444000_10611 [Shimia gijangensis]|uniref:Uncharacterized protein n=1 Tax=Shimia gijangensis TaxID=1470563 RepID=A0A1M6HCA1_9RHOB|nr:hypothetical protein [Shimia gijangensis]SHJ19774.1 hypothetical protein SAMN05444000_10611 [Shimia gijangensis]
MTEEKPDWVVLTENLEEPMDLEERASRIAAVLSTGGASTLFQKMLSHMIDPTGKKDRFCLALRHENVGRPKGPDWAVGFEMLKLVDDEGLSADEAIYRVKQKFGKAGTSRTKCFDALRAAREETRLRNIAERLLD